MTSALSCGDFEVRTLAHCSLFLAKVCFVAEAAEDVPRAYHACLSEVSLVCGHPTPDLRPCCLMIPDYYYLEAQDCSVSILVQDAVLVNVVLG